MRGKPGTTVPTADPWARRADAAQAELDAAVDDLAQLEVALRSRNLRAGRQHCVSAAARLRTIFESITLASHQP